LDVGFGSPHMPPGQSSAVPCGLVRLGFSLVVEVLRPRPYGQAPSPGRASHPGSTVSSRRDSKSLAMYLNGALVLVRQELFAALDRFRPADEILEIASRNRSWTTRLLRHASHVTGLGASSEMHQQAAAKRSTVIDASAPAAPSICPFAIESDIEVSPRLAICGRRLVSALVRQSGRVKGTTRGRADT
jgi:hypothetical protein